jgi:hypothetical protein
MRERATATTVLLQAVEWAGKGCCFAGRYSFGRMPGAPYLITRCSEGRFIGIRRATVVNDPSRHLRSYFHTELARAFHGIYPLSPAAVDYLSDMLAGYCRTSHLFRKNRAGEVMTALADMMAEAQGYRGLETAETFRPFEEARLVRHLGDYALFMAGLFQEYVERRAGCRLYIEVGQRAYLQVAGFEAPLDRRRSQVFAELGDAFEICVQGLTRLRRTAIPGLGRWGEIYVSDMAW